MVKSEFAKAVRVVTFLQTFTGLIHTLRPRQWVKNLFVAAPLVFSKHMLDAEFAIRTAIAVLAFCALSGAVYAFNDVFDLEADRQHPTKKFRPIAAGHVPVPLALATAFFLVVGSLTVLFLLSWKVALAAGIYAANNLAYSLYLKRFAFLDVLLISFGFLIRVKAGGLAISVPLSPWLLACSGLLASFLGFGKRAHELALQSESGAVTRASLASYSAKSLKRIMAILAVATCFCYGLYTLDSHTRAFFGTTYLIATLPFCCIGILRFYRLVFSTTSDSPTDAMLRDWPFLLNLALWGVAIVAIVYR